MEVQCGWSSGHVTPRLGNDEVRFTLFCMVTSPAACGLVHTMRLPCASVQPGGTGMLASGAPIVLNSPPAVAVVSLETTVLLIKFTFRASCIETPPPSQPATLFAMMLLKMLTSYHRSGSCGKRATSVPLTPCSRMPPPLPLSAVLPM